MTRTYWTKEGKTLHREQGPAIETPDGIKEWFQNGKRHREDGPAVEWPDGTKSWFKNGDLHREDGPAIEWPDGTKFWYKNGKCYREDGPAIEWPDGTKEWWINGIDKTTEIEQWFKEMGISCYKTQTDEQKVLFKLTWC